MYWYLCVSYRYNSYMLHFLLSLLTKFDGFLALAHSCGSCGYPLNLKSSNRITSGIGSKYRRSIKRGLISFQSIDLSRFTLVDEINCFLVAWAWHRSKTKLLCRKCASSIGYVYRDSTASPNLPSSAYRKFTVKIRALQPSEEES